MKVRATSLALCVLALVAGCGPSAPAGPAEAFPEYSLASLGGETLSRARFAGRVVIYDFWATWCGPCHLQADILRQLYPDIQGRGVEIVGIATGEEPVVVREFASKRPYPWPVLLDPEEGISNRLEVLGLPTLVITCKSGGISFRQTGVVAADRIERELAQAESC